MFELAAFARMPLTVTTSPTLRLSFRQPARNKALPLIYHRVGQGANNLGVVALDVRANPDDATQRAIRLGIPVREEPMTV